ncbi:hypothetical protein MO973_41730 [Paenibacillus sp. TRM 82003]|uniref:tyrosinase family oxidase copper chaperone n=1 Tax=Kineococcus sp. TRM81007 TaxID=2925831 RepID=UPI001F564F48|nr:tyrosinase family oxidase copper chaperone [Kineococcus sp. TRM81007]MCI2239722.1 hypothetical protein [Kineococcus sp. TRM81007]MCI3926715.1 hypothetical protein [Paenibacillus sp. TRM 82003]
MISRRHYIAGTWAVFSSVAIGTVVQPFSDAEAAGPPPEERFTYRGRRVDIVHQSHGHGVAHAQVRVRVNGRKEIHVHRGGPRNRYVTHALPFTEYSSPQQLARAVIDAEDAELLII